MNLSFSEWTYPTKKIKKQLIALNPSGLLAHAVGNVLTIFLEDEKGFNTLLSWAPFEHDISAMCWYDATNIPEIVVPILVLASKSKKVIIYDFCARKNIVAFNLTGDKPATIMKWSPISSSRFFIGTASGDFHCCSLVLGQEAQFNIEWTINLDFKIDFISFEPHFSKKVLVASKSGQLNFIYNVHSKEPIISPENYTLCGNNNKIYSCVFVQSSANYLLVVSKLGTIIYAIAEQESFNLFKDHKLKYLYPVNSNGNRLIGVNNEAMSLYESDKGNFRRVYELPIMPNVSNLPAYQTEFVYNNDRVIFVSYNWWLTTVKVIKDKLFITNRVRLLPGKPIDYSFRIRSIALSTNNGYILATRSSLVNNKQNLQKSNDSGDIKKTPQPQKNKDEFDIPREDSESNLSSFSNDLSADLHKIATRSIIYHQRRRSFGTQENAAPSKIMKDHSSKNELAREIHSDYNLDKNIRNPEVLRKPTQQEATHGRKSNYALKKTSFDSFTQNTKNENQKSDQGQQINQQETNQQENPNSPSQHSSSQIPNRSQSHPNLDSPQKKQKTVNPEAFPSSDAQQSPDKKEPVPKFNIPESNPQQKRQRRQTPPEKKEEIPKFNIPESQTHQEQSPDKKETIPKFNSSLQQTSSVPSFPSNPATKTPPPKLSFQLPPNSPDKHNSPPNSPTQAGETLPSMGQLESFKPPTKGSPSNGPRSISIHADPTVLSQSRRLRSMSMHPSAIGDSDTIKQIADNARKHYKNVTEVQDEFTTLSEFGNSRKFIWCYKLCDVPLSHIEWISSTKVLAFGTQIRGSHYIHHLYLVDIRLRSVTRVLGDRLNALNLPFTSLTINRYQKICALVLDETLVMFISFNSSTPRMIGSMSFDSKVIVSFSPTPESTKALIVCQNDVVFIDYDIKNNTIRQTDKCTFDIKTTITAALWKRMALVLGDEEGNLSIVTFSPYQREDCLNLKNPITQIYNHQQGTMLVIDSKNAAYIMSPRKIDYTFPFPVKQIRQLTNNEFIVRGSGKGTLSVVSLKGRYVPHYTVSVRKCMIMKPRGSWINLLKDAISNCISSSLTKDESSQKYIKIAQQFGMPLTKKMLISMENPNFTREQIRFIRDIVITNSHLNELTMKLSLMIDDFEMARAVALRTEKSSKNYLLNICKSILLRSSPDKDVIKESVMQLFLDDMYQEGVDLFMIFGMWQEAVSKLLTIGNVKEAMLLLMSKVQENEEVKNFIDNISKNLIESEYFAVGLILVALSGGIKKVIDKYRDLGEFEQASFLEKMAK